MYDLRKAAALLAVIVFTFTGIASIAFAATNTQKQNFSLYQKQNKPARTASRKDCSNPFPMPLPHDAPARRTTASFFGGGMSHRSFRQTVAFDDPR